MTGFGRTGKWFSYQHWSVTPDIVTLSKGINSGISPLGAVVVSKKIADYFDNYKLLAGLTNSGHPISCAAGVGAIKIYKEEHLIQKTAKMGLILEKMAKNLRNKYPVVIDTRTLGLFSGIEFGKLTNNFDAISFVNEMSKRAYRLGLYLYTRLNCVLIAPPLIISRKELAWGMKILEKAIKNTIVSHSKN